jgi:hypothetical protein
VPECIKDWKNFEDTEGIQAVTRPMILIRMMTPRTTAGAMKNIGIATAFHPGRNGCNSFYIMESCLQISAFRYVRFINHFTYIST